MHIKLAIFFYPKRIRIPVVIKYNAVNKTDTMSNIQTKDKKMHVASVTLTNNNESNEKQMLKKNKKNWQGSNLMKEPLEQFYASRLSTQSTG